MSIQEDPTAFDGAATDYLRDDITLVAELWGWITTHQTRTTTRMSPQQQLALNTVTDHLSPTQKSILRSQAANQAAFSAVTALNSAQEALTAAKEAGKAAKEAANFAVLADFAARNPDELVRIVCMCDVEDGKRKRIANPFTARGASGRRAGFRCSKKRGGCKFIWFDEPLNSMAPITRINADGALELISFARKDTVVAAVAITEDLIRSDDSQANVNLMREECFADARQFNFLVGFERNMDLYELVVNQKVPIDFAHVRKIDPVTGSTDIPPLKLSIRKGIAQFVATEDLIGSEESPLLLGYFAREFKSPDVPTKVKLFYNSIRKNSSTGGNGYQGAIYGELSMENMNKIVQEMVRHCGLNDSSRFIDVGSGLGKPNFHVQAFVPGIKLSLGVELEEIRWQLAMHNLSASADYGIQGINFIWKDVLSLKNFLPFTIIYCYGFGMPPNVLSHMATLFMASIYAQYFVTTFSESKVLAAGFVVILIYSIDSSMTVSGEIHKMYFYKKVSMPSILDKSHATLMQIGDEFVYVGHDFKEAIENCLDQDKLVIFAKKVDQAYLQSGRPDRKKG